MSTKVKERPAAALSPERQALASAIGALRQNEQRIAQLRAADDRAFDAVRDADDRLAQARKAIEEGKAARTRDLVEGTNKAPTANALRIAEQEAADDLETAREARRQIALELADLESRGSSREGAVKQAAVAVLAVEAGDEIARLVERMIALRLEHLTIARS